MAVDLDRIGRASLKELGDIRIDDVLSFIDRGIEKMPSYMDLYRRWESQQWSVGDLDFSLDRQDWLESNELDRKATLWSHRLFFNGEERVTHAGDRNLPVDANGGRGAAHRLLPTVVARSRRHRRQKSRRAADRDPA
ncbi:MAG: hypothetical protein E6I05_03090 [Chloroflexi bacterium]|nr:MAG: hypothetical protein E6I05_03090 [Chloroflexota bacterium]